MTSVGEESFLAQVVARHLEEARAMKPGVPALVDLVLHYYLPGVLVFAGAALIIWTVGAWLVIGRPDWTRAVFAMLAVLVMGYPCALGMATPLAMIRGGGEAARQGILMRSGEAFQVFKDVKKVVLDKTGTLTVGEPMVTDVVVGDWGLENGARRLEIGDSPHQELLRLAAGAEQVSEHPLARAVVLAALDRGINIPTAQDFEALPGRGVRSMVDGRRVLVGSPTWLASLGLDLDALATDLPRLQAEGKTVVVVAEAPAFGDAPRHSQSALRCLGLIAIADAPKADAAEAVRRLRVAGMEPVMLTGDHWATARAIAAQVGVTQVHTEVLPGQTAAVIRQLQRDGTRVAMVGDGINDAPAPM